MIQDLKVPILPLFPILTILPILHILPILQDKQVPNPTSLLIPVVYSLTLKPGSAHPLHVQEGEMEQDTSALDHVLVSSKISKTSKTGDRMRESERE
jgi:hypothetical protein